MTLHPYLEQTARGWLTFNLRELPLSSQRKFKLIYSITDAEDIEAAVNAVPLDKLSAAMFLVERSLANLGPKHIDWLKYVNKPQTRTPDEELKEFKVGGICWLNSGSPDLEIVEITHDDDFYKVKVHYRGTYFVQLMHRFTINKVDNNPFHDLKT